MIDQPLLWMYSRSASTFACNVFSPIVASSNRFHMIRLSCSAAFFNQARSIIGCSFLYIELESRKMYPDNLLHTAQLRKSGNFEASALIVLAIFVGAKEGE